MQNKTIQSFTQVSPSYVKGDTYSLTKGRVCVTSGKSAHPKTTYILNIALWYPYFRDRFNSWLFQFDIHF